MSKKTVMTLLASVLAVAISMPVLAQDLPFFNRSLKKISFVQADETPMKSAYARPTQAGKSRTMITAEWVTSVAAAGFVDVNFNADLQLEINGMVVDTLAEDDVNFSGDPSGCSTNDPCGPCPSTSSCFVGVPGKGCACGTLRLAAFAPQPLQPGDLVRITVMPARGGVSEEFTDDDSLETFFPTRNRAIEQVSIRRESNRATDLWWGEMGKKAVVEVDWSAFAAESSAVSRQSCGSAPPFPEGINFNAELQLEVNGRVVDRLAQQATFFPTDSDCDAMPPCSQQECGFWIPAFTTGACSESAAGDVIFCGCKRIFKGFLTAPTLNPFDRVRVRIVPSRGGFAEQFTGDDQQAVPVRLLDILK